jgi:2-iminobutanoate/2-iminopropanoate deaminase
MKTLNSQNAPKAIGPYSQASYANGMVYVSGQIPVNPATGELETDIGNATARCLQNIRAILAEDGLSLANAVKITVYLADMADFSVVNEVYAQYFSAPYPARVCVAVSALPKNARIEIDCIAAVPAE